MANKMSQWLRGVVLQNQGMKVLSLVLAVLTFYGIRNATNDEDTYVVPVTSKLEPDVEIVEQNPLTATVTFRGSREDLKKLDPKDLKVELSPRFADGHPITMRPRDIKTVPGTRVVNIIPSVASFTLRRKPRIEKSEPVSVVPPPVLENKPEIITREWTNITVMAVGEPRTVGSVLITPPAATLICQGPAYQVNSMTSGVPIIFVDCSDMKVSEIVQRLVKVYYPGQTNMIFTVRPPSVEISFWKNEKE